MYMYVQTSPDLQTALLQLDYTPRLQPDPKRSLFLTRTKLLKVLLGKIEHPLKDMKHYDEMTTRACCLRIMACHERKIRMLANLRSDYPCLWQEFEVSNHDMIYPY